jgi:hypothetical protein
LQLPDLGCHATPSQYGVHRFGYVVVDGHTVPALDFDENVECRRCLALQYGLLSAPSAGLFVT